MGQLPAGAVHLVETVADAAAFIPRDVMNLAYATQTTLSVDDTAEIVAFLKARFPGIVGPHKEDICYATTNRQEAVKRVAPDGRCHDRGRRAEFVELPAAARSRGAFGLREGGRWCRRARPTSTGTCSAILRGSASPPALPPPKFWSRKSSDAFAARYAVEVEIVRDAHEDVFFPLPRQLRGTVAAGVGDGRLYRCCGRGSRSLSDGVRPSANCCPTRSIAEGVENTNFLLHTSRGYFILTLYEKRVGRRRPAVFPRPDGGTCMRAGSTARSRYATRAGEALGKLANAARRDG